jgi:hypothetical protein
MEDGRRPRLKQRRRIRVMTWRDSPWLAEAAGAPEPSGSKPPVRRNSGGPDPAGRRPDAIHGCGYLVRFGFTV